MPITIPMFPADATPSGHDDLAERLPDSLDDYASLNAEDAAGLGL